MTVLAFAPANSTFKDSEELLSFSRKDPPPIPVSSLPWVQKQPLSPWLLIHFHGGGFVAQTSRSHEVKCKQFLYFFFQRCFLCNPLINLLGKQQLSRLEFTTCQLFHFAYSRTRITCELGRRSSTCPSSLSTTPCRLKHHFPELWRNVSTPIAGLLTTAICWVRTGKADVIFACFPGF